MTNIPARRRQLIAPWLDLKAGTRALNPGEGIVGLGVLQAFSGGGGAGLAPGALLWGAGNDIQWGSGSTLTWS
jgi:hypothetical protein